MHFAAIGSFDIRRRIGHRSTSNPDGNESFSGISGT